MLTGQAYSKRGLRGKWVKEKGANLHILYLFMLSWLFLPCTSIIFKIWYLKIQAMYLAKRKIKSKRNFWLWYRKENYKLFFRPTYLPKTHGWYHSLLFSGAFSDNPSWQFVKSSWILMVGSAPTESAPFQRQSFQRLRNRKDHISKFHVVTLYSRIFSSINTKL